MMNISKIAKYGSDIGKYLVDISKIVLGSLVIAPVVKDDFSIHTDGYMLITGIAVSVFTAVSGIFLMNKNK